MLASDWQNPLLPQDVDATDLTPIVSPIDALLVINELNQRRSSSAFDGKLPFITEDSGSLSYFDVSGDGYVTPIDALLVINFLNRPASSESALPMSPLERAAEVRGEAEPPPANENPLFSGPAEMLVNTTTRSVQEQPAVAVLPSGAVVVWTSLVQDGSGWGVYGQRLDASGAKIGSEFRISQTTKLSQWSPKVDAWSDGRFVVTWESLEQPGENGWGVFARIFDANGSPLTDEFRVNQTTLGTQWHPTVAALTDGTFAIAWEGRGTIDASRIEDYDIFVRQFSAQGVPLTAQQRINSSTLGFQEHAAIAALSDGGFAVVYNGFGSPDPAGVYLRRFGAGAAPLGSEILVNRSFQLGDQRHAALDAAADGSLLVAWSSTNHQSAWGVYAQQFSPDGAFQGGEIAVNQTTLGLQWHPSVVAMEGGVWAIAWEGYSLADPYGVYFRRFDNAGLPLAGEQRINQTTIGLQRDPVLASGPGGLIAVWDGWGAGDYDGILARGATSGSLGANQAPMNGVPAAQVTNEDLPLAFNSAHSNRISVADPDAGTATLQVTLSVTTGTLTLGSTVGLTFSSGTGAANTSMVFSGTLNSLNAALNNLIYAAPADFNGAVTLSITTNDLGHSGTGGAQSDSDTVSISVLSVNDAPSFTKGANQEVSAAAGQQSVGAWATNLSRGPADEAGQALNFLVSVDNPALFAALPAIAADGTLTYTPATDAAAQAMVTVRLHDNGGTDRGGQDTSPPQTFTIAISNTAIDSSPFTLLEGSSYSVAIDRTFIVPAGESTLQIEFDPPVFDTQSQGTVRDAFEAALIDANGQTLVHTIAGSRDAFLNQTEGAVVIGGVNTALVGGMAKLDLSHIPAGTAATLRVRLVNNDADTTTSVHVSNLSILSGSLNTPAGAAFPAAQVADVPTASELSSLQDITSDFGILYGTTSLREAGHVLYADVSLRNNGSAAFSGPLLAVIDGISDPTVAVRSFDGLTPDGRPYFNMHSLVTGGILAPDQTTGSRAISFFNPQGIQFTFHVSVLVPANMPPALGEISTLQALVGQPFRFDVAATDAEGNPIEFSLLGGPPTMTIDPASGRIDWTPTTNDLGTQQVRVRVDDGAGGAVESSFTVVVRQDIPNRPPVITSSPITDAGVALSFQISDVAVGRGPVSIAVGDFTGTGTSLVTANELSQTVSLATNSGQMTYAPAVSTLLGEPPPRTDQLFEQGYNLDVGMAFNRTQNVQGMTSADFNSDGIADFAVTIHSEQFPIYQEAVSVLLGLGDGTYQPPRLIYQVISQDNTNPLTGILTRDFDQDGIADLLVGENGTKNLMFFKGHGDGTFADAVRSATNYLPQYLRADDLNHDGTLDIAMIGTVTRDGNWQPEVLLGNGDGTFAAPTDYASQFGRYLSDIQLGDVDGQNGPDLVIAEWDNNRIEIRLNDGSGHFGDPLFQNLTSFEGCCSTGHGPPAALTLGDFDTDGKLDIVAGNYGDDMFLKGNGDGTFVVPPSSSPLIAHNGVVTSHAYVDAGNQAIDLNGDGKLDVYAANRFNNILTVGLGRGDGTFDYRLMFAQPASDDPTILPEGGGFSGALAVDANNDGVPDIAVMAYAKGGSRPGRFSIVLGDIPGSFRTPQILPPGGASNSFADLNNDGAPDLLQIGGPLYTSINNADGTFPLTERALGSFSGAGEFFLSRHVTADFDGDGNLDVLFAGTGGVQGGPGARYIVSLGLGNGLFQSPTIFGNGAAYLAAVDLTGDGKPEVIGTTDGRNTEVWINNGTGNGFVRLSDANHRLQYPQTSSYGGFALADFDGDGVDDLVAHSIPGQNNTPAEQFLFWHGHQVSNPTDISELFDAPVITTPGLGDVSQMIAVDLNDDGKRDLVMMGYFQFFVMLGNGDGTFGSPTTYPDGLDYMTVADFNGDGVPDVGLSNSFYAPTFRLGNGDGTFGRAQYYPASSGANYSVDAADVDGDGKADFLSLTGNDAGSYHASNIYLSRRPGIQAVATGDVNGDGKLDAVAVDYGMAHLTPLLGDGAGNLTRQPDLLVGRGPVAAMVSDLNGDQHQDIVSVNRAANTISVLIADGVGGFTRTDLATGRRPVAIAVQDIIGDGSADLVVANSDEPSLSIFENLGNGSFAVAELLPIGIRPTHVSLGDVNGDGKADIIVTSETDHAYVVALNQGNGTFAVQSAIPIAASIGGMALGDLNGDGRADLVVTNPAEHQVSLYVGLGAGKFATPQPIHFDHTPTDVKLADINGDGGLDIVTTNSDSDVATVIISRFNPAAVYRYQVTAADADGDPVAFALQAGPSGMIIDSFSGQITWSATPDQVGTHQVVVQASDGRGGVATQTYKLEVTAQGGNFPPRFVTTPIATALSTTDYHYSARAADADKDPLRFELADGPSGMTVDPNTGNLSWGNPIGRGLTMNGVDDMVVVGSTPALNFNNEFTYSTWVKFDKTPVETGHDAYLVGTSSQVDLVLSARNYSGSARFEINTFGRRAVSNTVIQDGQWYHVTATYTFGQTIRLYVNGVAEAEVTVSDIQSHPSQSFFTFGNSPSDGNRNLGLAGSLDSVRIFNAAFTPQQADDEFQRIGPDAPGLIGDWGFNELDGPIARDHSNFSNDGILAAPYAGRRMRTTFNDKPEPAGRAGDYPVVLRVTDGRGGTAEQAFTLHVTAEAPATFTGIVFDDLNADGQQTPDEAGLVNWTVYLDLNHNGTRDSAEPNATTDALGKYVFRNLTPGTYTVAIAGRTGWQTTTPANGNSEITLAAGQTAVVDQYASSVIAFSSQYSPGSYSAAQALGSPNTLNYGDSLSAWAAASANGTQEFLTLGFSTPLPADGVTIRETWGNGFVTQIDLLDTNDVLHTVWAGVDPSQPGAPVDFTVNFPQTSYLVRGVKVYVDGNHNLSTWEEIDSVQLHGVDLAAVKNFGQTNLGVSSEVRGPAFISPPVTSGQVGSSYAYQMQVRNLDGRPLEFDVLVAPDGVAINRQTGGIAWLPSAEQGGNSRIIIRVKDDRGLVDVQDFIVTIASAPTSPAITSQPSLQGVVGATYRYSVLAQDAEGGPLTFQLDVAPPGMTIDSQTGNLLWTPAANQSGAALVELRVSDALGLFDTQSFSILVAASAVNHPPHITSLPRLGAGLGRPYLYQVVANDYDGDPLSFTLLSGPAGMTLDAGGMLRWVPDQLGDFGITLRVSDGRGGSEPQSFTLRVASQLSNSAPQFTSVPPTAAIAGERFAYNALATDQDGDPVQYVLDQGPAGLSLDPVRGTIRWQTAASQRGDYVVTLRAIDPYGAEAFQSFTLAVRSANEPPAISSVPPTEAAADVLYSYQVAAADPFGRPLTYSLLAAPTGMAIDAATGLVTWTPSLLQTGAHSVLIQAANGQGGAATQGFDIVTTDGSPNLPPRITSSAPSQATVGVLYQYDIQATDPEGQALHYQLRTGPAGMSVDFTSGRVTWTPKVADLGSVQVTVAALDPANAAGVQTFLLTVLNVNHFPTIASTAPSQPLSAGAVLRYTVAARDEDHDVLTYTLSQAPSGLTIDNFGRILWPTTTADLGSHPVNVLVNDGRGGIVSQAFTVNVVADTVAPRVTVIPATNLVYAFNSLAIRVSATDDVGIASVVLTMDGQPIPLDGQGRAVIPWPGTSRISTFVATATDTSGNTSQSSTNVKFFNSAEVSSAPQVAILSPADTGVVFGPADVMGTVSDDNLREWKLFVRPEEASDNDFVEISSGTTTVNNGFLGHFDPTLLENGSYLLRLDAIDNSGNETFTDSRIGVSGELKLGNFQLAFTDLTIPVNGIPITVTRTYDTLRANRQGDFGFGWRLDFRNADLRTGLAPTGLESYGVFAAFRPGTKVYLTLPGGRREGFTFTPDIRSLFELTTVTPKFTPDPGVTNTLSVRGGTFLLGDDGAIYSGGGQPYNPAADEFGGGYTVTTREGLVYNVDGQTGLLRTVTDRNDNRLTFGESGVSSSSGVTVHFQRDPAGRIVSVTDPSGQQIRYTYSAAGNLTSTTDRGGNTTQYQYLTAPAHYLDKVIDPLGRTGVRADYDADGRLIRIFDAQGHSVQTSYDPNNQLVTVTDALGNPTTFEYDLRGNVVSQIDALGGISRTTYNSLDQPLTETDQLGRITRHEYDANGNETSRTDPAGNTTRATFNAYTVQTSLIDALGNSFTASVDSRGNPLNYATSAGTLATIDYAALGVVSSLTIAGVGMASVQLANDRLLQSIDAAGAVSNFSYDASGLVTSISSTVTTPTGSQTVGMQAVRDSNGRVIRETDPLGNSVQYEYDANGNRVAFVDRLGHRTEYEFDSLNRLVRTTFADGTVEQRTYDAANHLISLVDRGGQETRYQYDALGRQTVIIFPDATPAEFSDNPRRSTTYDLAGQVTSQTDELGHSTAYVYDLAGNRIRVTDAIGGITQGTYDANRNLIAITDPIGRSTQYVYNSQGLPLTTIFADGSREMATYDVRGNLLSRTNAAGETTRYEYDARQQLTAVVDPLGGRTRYAYDELGRHIRTTDALGRVTRFEYDLAGRLTATVLPTGERDWRSYDAEGDLISHTDFGGVIIQFQYDVMGRVTMETRPEQIIQTSYSAAGLRSQVTDARGTTSYAYDARQQMTRLTEPDGRTIQYAYDAAGNVLSVTTPAGAVSYQYDALNRPAAVIDPSGGITTYQFDAAGSQIGLAYPNGVVETRTMNALGRATSIETTNSIGDTIARFTYTFDAASRRSSVTELNGRRTDYQYDAAGRLVGETLIDAVNGNRTTTYSYDAAGNRLTRQDSLNGTTTYTYDARDRLLQEVTGPTTTNYTYDGNGNLLAKDAGPMARTVYTWDSANHFIGENATTASGTTAIVNGYDADGIRVSRTTDGTQVKYLVDTNREYAQVIEEYTTAGVILAAHVFGPGDLGQISQTLAGARVYYHADSLGSTLFLTNESGAITDQFRYDAYGQLLLRQGTTDVAFQFTGEQRDEAGLDYLRARFYDSHTGRFASMDPFDGSLRDPLTLHKYQYASLDPVNAKDPSGKLTLAETLVVSGTLGVLGGVIGGVVQHIRGGSVLRGVFIGFTVGFSAGLSFGAVSSLGVGASSLNTFLTSYGTSQTVLADIAAQLGSLIEARGGLAAVFAIATGATVFTADVFLFGIYDVVRYINDEINSAHTTAAGVH